MRDFEFGPNCPPGSAAHADLSGILAGSYEQGAVMPYAPKLIVDVGANVGAFTLWARRRYPDALIVAIEPSPHAFEILQRNVRGESGIVLVPMAASNGTGPATLFKGGCTLGESSLHDIGQQSRDSSDVWKVSLDMLLPGPPDIMKIDTEGHELQVLAGCADWPNGGLNRVTYVAMEVHRRADELPITHLLERHGMRVASRTLEGSEDRIVLTFTR